MWVNVNRYILEPCGDINILCLVDLYKGVLLIIQTLEWHKFWVYLFFVKIFNMGPI